MSDGVVLHRVALDRHQCRKPGSEQRKELNLDFGSIWQCPCGVAWKLTKVFGASEWVVQPLYSKQNVDILLRELWHACRQQGGSPEDEVR